MHFLNIYKRLWFLKNQQIIFINFKKTKKMKKTILAIGLMVALASCGSVAEHEGPVADTTAVVAVDSAAVVIADSTSVDSLNIAK